ncbi:major capsid protein [Microviridae sp.]|nr:major capsid protein [Microviridae sp.]
MVKSVMSTAWNQIPKAELPRSSFNRSHGHKTTFDAGKLVPIYVDEALPGDTFNLKLTAFSRLATPIKPIMDNMFMETFFFSVPVRQIWANWTKFNGEQIQPGDSTDFQVPLINLDTAGSAEGSLADHFGLPINKTYSVNSLHFRAVQHIWNEWFRDQNLLPYSPVPIDDGPDPQGPFTNLPPRRKRPDYFTSCLPWAQKGDPVLIPVASTAPVVPSSTDPIPTFKEAGLGSEPPKQLMMNDTSTAANWQSQPTLNLGAQWVYSGLEADLASATGVSINSLRRAFQVQKVLERDARSGTRYPETLRAHFGVTDPQMLVHQRPEFLGGGQSMVNINPVQQTAATDPAATPQGNLAAEGTVTLNNHGFTKSFTEHCLLVGFVNVRADLNYQEGIDRMWVRRTRFDYYWPALSHIGEQSVQNLEIHFVGTPATDNAVFGYQERYAEYRYKPSKITGKFRSAASDTLDVWHLAEKFENTPVLNQDFILDNPPVDRVVAVPSEPHFLFDGYFNLQCARVMPTYGTPGMIDHF